MPRFALFVEGLDGGGGGGGGGGVGPAPDGGGAAGEFGGGASVGPLPGGGEAASPELPPPQAARPIAATDAKAAFSSLRRCSR